MRALLVLSLAAAVSGCAAFDKMMPPTGSTPAFDLDLKGAAKSATSMVKTGVSGSKRIFSDTFSLTAEKHCKDLSRYELSPEQEYYVGRAATANVLARYGAANALPADHPVAV
ncbi:MAG: hypothetical protein ACK4N5_09585, partial [Myxococcales bacterium]